MWWNLVVVGPHVHLLVGVDTGEDEEHSRAPGSTYQKTTKSKDDSSLVLLENIKHLKNISWLPRPAPWVHWEEIFEEKL